MGLISNGSTIFDNGSMASGFGGSLVFLSKQTASASSSISFTSGIDSTYKEYLFTFKNIHASSLDARLTFQCSTDGGSNYNTTVTSTSFRTFHDESDSLAIIGYQTGSDQAQGTSFERLTESFATNNDDNAGGYLQIFNPSSTTFVKHFIANTNVNRDGGGISQNFQAGYFNTTNSVDAIQFKMNSGNIDAGDICLYGIA
jgi:hypothetical protein